MGKPLLGTAPAIRLLRYPARSCSRHVESDCWRDGYPLPNTTGLHILLERCPCQFHKPIVQVEQTLTLSVHFVWPKPGYQGADSDLPQHCGFLLHLHALVHDRSHFMPHKLPDHQLVAGTWVLPKEQGSGLLWHRDGHNMVEDLHNSTSCSNLRKLARPQAGDQVLSVC